MNKYREFTPKNRPQVRGEQTADIYTRVTQFIIDKLEQNIIPWQKTWGDGIPPSNYVSKRPYSGINTLLLSCQDFESSYFMTIHQANELGGRVRKGAKGNMVIFAKTNQDEDEQGEAVISKVIRQYYVFNVADIEGVDFNLQTNPRNIQRNQTAETLISKMPSVPKFLVQGHHACYNPLTDTVKMPPIADFLTAEDYYCTLFHELIHSTGHYTRLNRPTITDSEIRFGSKDYSLEELVAEIGACFLLKKGGLDTQNASLLDNSVAYIKNWLTVLKNDKRFILEAASKAQKAADYILGEAAE